MHTLDIAPLRSESPPQKRSGVARVLKGFHSFYLHTHTFIRNRNEPYLPLPSQPQLVLIYRPQMDGRLSRTVCVCVCVKDESKSRGLELFWVDGLRDRKELINIC